MYVYMYEYIYIYIYGFTSGPVVKNLSAMQKTRVQFLDWEDPMEKGNINPL